MPESPDPIDWIKHLEGPEPPAEAPSWDAKPQTPFWRNGPIVGTGLALAAASLLWVSLPVDDGVRWRGGTGAVDVDFRMVALTDKGPERFRSGHTYPTGQKLAVRLAATPASTVSVWAEGPNGRTELGVIDAEPTAVDLKNDSGLVTLSLDSPGQWTVSASAAGTGKCPADACVSRVVNVSEPAE